MKKFLLSAAAVLAVFLAVFVPALDAKAQNVASIVYDFSAYPVPDGVQSEFTLDQSVMLNLLQKNADGTFAVDAAGNYSADQGAISSFVAGLASLYELPGYTVLNQDMEKQYLISAITLGLSASRTPLMTVSSVPGAEESAKAQITESQSSEDFQTTAVLTGQTYIDINITEQKLTFYQNGVPTLVSDVVTGNESAHNDTPQGTYQVYGKSTDRTLKGPGYESYVKYWMPFTGNYGIHDASWRSSFGGSIYKTNGSHGCVNMPRSMAEALYNTITVGTTVIIHS
ncbi:MAG: L,D-transpeptidase [Lachnospiraceae bacterium]|nr:L,D-transpeptidase [Lachnospiraceae bacterium]MBR1524851.1 L,D-transpeptidase [Lachnospiraceae bacterium]